MLVGRETERARIDALLAGAREGRGGAPIIAPTELISSSNAAWRTQGGW